MPGIDSNTKLMLHCQRPDNTLPKAVTFVGTAQLDTAQKKFGASSLLVDGNSDYVTVPDSADWTSTNITIDFWVRLNTHTGTTGFWGQAVDASNYTCFYLTSSTLGFTSKTGGTLKHDLNWVGSFTTGVWYHIAMVKDGSDWECFQDGVSLGTSSDADAIPDIAAAFSIGSGSYAGTTYYTDGWIDSFRVSNYARWISNFTPNTYAPLSDTNTQLLLHFDGADAATATYDSAGGDENGTADKAPTYNGTAQIDTTYPVTFVGTAQLDTAQKKFGTASLLLDGNSDNLTVPDNADWAFLTGDFTIDFWFRWDGAAQYCGICGQYVDATNWWRVLINMSLGAGSGSIAIHQAVGGTEKSAATTQSYISATTWYHIAIARSGTSVKIFLDGVDITNSNTLAGTNMPDIASTLRIGNMQEGGTQFWTGGHIDAFRISKGYARWTAPFSVPTTAPVADTRTQLLLNFDDGADGATATNNGISSLYLDANYDLLTFPDSADWDFSNGDFTQECWVKFEAITNATYPMFTARDNGNDWQWGLDELGLFDGVKRYIFFKFGASSHKVEISALTVGKWYHMAVSRDSANLRLFIDGVEQGSTYNIGTNSLAGGSAVLFVGHYATSGDTNAQVHGWMREIRITKGLARYTTNFTPQVALFSSDPGTSIKKIAGVSYADIKKVSGVAIASVKKVLGVA